MDSHTPINESFDGCEARHYLRGSVRGSLPFGLLLAMMSGLFLLSLGWTFFIPLFIILIGVGILMMSMLPS